MDRWDSVRVKNGCRCGPVCMFIDMCVYIHSVFLVSTPLLPLHGGKKGGFLAMILADPLCMYIDFSTYNICGGPYFTGKHACVAFTRAANLSAHESVSSESVKAAQRVQTCSGV